MESSGTAPGFHHVVIRALDFDETVQFYTQGLGFRVHLAFAIPPRMDRAVFLEAGDRRFIEVSAKPRPPWLKDGGAGRTRNRPCLKLPGYGRLMGT